MDERYKVAISRLGKRVRVAGSAEIGGSPPSARTSALGDARQGARRLVSRRRAAQRRRSAGKARGRCCPTGRRCSAPSGADGRLAQPRPRLQRLGARRAARRASLADAIAGRTDADRRSTASASSGLQRDERRRAHRRATIGRHRAVRRRRDARGSKREALRGAAAPTLMARAGEAVARLALALAPHARRMRRLRRARATTAATASRPRLACVRSAGKPTSVLASAIRPRCPPTRARRSRAPRRPASTIAPSTPPSDRWRSHRIWSSTPCSASARSRAPEGAIAAAIGRIAELARSRRAGARGRRAVRPRRRSRPAARRRLRRRRRTR